MATYVILNSIFMGAVFLVMHLKVGPLIWNRHMRIVLAVLLLSTAVFDSIIISAGIVDYDPSRILGMRIGTAPVEDFFYAIMAAILVPNVWHWLRKDGHAGN